MITIGITGTKEDIVCEHNTAIAMGSGTLPVFATPSMIALMEKAASESVKDLLSEGESTVGVSLNVRHVSATPVGMKVRCDSKLVEIEKRKLVFEVEAYDECGLIGSGIHERFIIACDKFMEKAEQKQSKNE